MAPKAVDARKRLNRNRRFRGHGPLLQKRDPIPATTVHPSLLPPTSIANRSYNTAP